MDRVAEAKKGPFAHTYSIVARDLDTGEMGVAVQSHWFSVGSVVTWGEAGVGVVATQSFTNPAFGPTGLAMLRVGRDPEDVVATLINVDPGRELRQLAVLNTKGKAAAFTGPRCVPECGHIVGRDFSVQANMMSSAEVWPAMAEAFRSSEGPLADRMVAALEAAEARGGDFRGRQSAALLIVRKDLIGKPWLDRAVDLRVEDHPDPVQELKRLVKVHRAYQRMNDGDLALEKGDMPSAFRSYEEAQAMYPENEEMTFWTAAGLASNGRLEEALPLFARVFERNGRWRKVIPALVGSGQLKVSPEEQDRIMQA
jgi:uncharacterized Ntn-hydrolase superfamily protein